MNLSALLKQKEGSNPFKQKLTFDEFTQQPIRGLVDFSPISQISETTPRKIDITALISGGFWSPSPEGIRIRDVARELPAAALSMGKEIAQSLLREGIAVSALMPNIRQILDKEKYGQYTPQTKIEKRILGTDKPISLASVGRELPLAGKAPTPIAIGLGMLSAAFDFYPMGGNELKTLSKQIAKTAEKESIIKLLTKKLFKKIDDPGKLDDIAKILVKETDPKRVGEFLRGLTIARKATEKAISETVIKIPPKQQQKIVDNLYLLNKEAKELRDAIIDEKGVKVKDNSILKNELNDITDTIKIHHPKLSKKDIKETIDDLIIEDGVWKKYDGDMDSYKPIEDLIETQKNIIDNWEDFGYSSAREAEREEGKYLDFLETLNSTLPDPEYTLKEAKQKAYDLKSELINKLAKHKIAKPVGHHEIGFREYFDEEFGDEIQKIHANLYKIGDKEFHLPVNQDTVNSKKFGKNLGELKEISSKKESVKGITDLKYLKDVVENFEKKYSKKQAQPITKKVKPIIKTAEENIIKPTTRQAMSVEKNLLPPYKKEEIILPAVIRGESFILGESKIIQPTKTELRKTLKQEIKATKQEIKNAEIAEKKAAKLAAKQQKIREETIKSINRFHGSTERIIKQLKKRHLSDEDITNIILEDGTKLIDTIGIKRTKDGTLAAVITKKDIADIAKSYKRFTPTEKWIKQGGLTELKEGTKEAARWYELPYVFLKSRGLDKLYDKIIGAGRGAEELKQLFLKRFKDVGLYKKGGWFTADRFNLSQKEAEHIGKYYLSRQSRGYNYKFTDLTLEEQKFVEVFDNIIKDTEKRFYEVAKKNGKNPRKVENYAPIMTRDDIKLADEAGTMEWLFRNHPAFFSLKERTPRVPEKLYETDYRKVASRWLNGITDFLNYGETTPQLKYLINNDKFKKIVSGEDWEIIAKWLQDITTPKPLSKIGKVPRFLRKTTAMASLGLNYASVLKQALSQIPIMIIEKVQPRFKSKFAKAFGIDVAKLSSITKRSGDIAITDLQGRIGRIFTGALTEFDRRNAQLSLNGLLDKIGKDVYKQWEKTGIRPSDEIINKVLKEAQDKIDLWYGGFFKGQKPKMFRSEVGNFINMFIYPLTSQLNGFYYHYLTKQGVGNKAKALAEIMAAATTIAYMEQVITNLSLKWSDEKEMTKDVLQSLLGNIPILSQISYAMLTDQQLQVSAGISGINNLLVKKIPQYLRDEKDLKDVGFAAAELFGLPKQIRRFYEGMEIINEGGIRDKNGKILAPVKDVDEIMRSFLRGRYGSLAAKDWIRNIGIKKEQRRWFTPQVEFLQNGDYDRKAQIYRQLSGTEQKELRNFLSEGQQKKLDKALSGLSTKKILDNIFGSNNKKILDSIFYNP